MTRPSASISSRASSSSSGIPRPLRSISEASTVDQSLVSPSKFKCPSLLYGGDEASTARHSEDEEAVALLARANFTSREDEFRTSEASFLKVGSDSVEVSALEVRFDVFEEDPRRLGFADDPAERRPEVAGIVFALLEAGVRVGLTGDAGNDASHLAAPSSAVEGDCVGPDRSLNDL